MVPSASFGLYDWGRPVDEPLQVLARTPWLVRDAVPLGGPGITRVLDAVEQVLGSGRGSPALADYLARAGVRHLVVRNDLDLQASGSVPPLLVHAALAGSPGITRVAAFGRPVGLGQGEPGKRLVATPELQPVFPAVEVFEVEPAQGADAVVTSYPTAGTQQVHGGPETLLPLLASGVTGPRTAVRLAGEDVLPDEPAAAPVVTDGYRDRESSFGRATDTQSATFGAGEQAQADRPVHDYLPVPPEGTRTTAVVHGATSVRSSSSAADADALLLRGPEHHAVAAFDDDPATSWLSGGLLPVGQWVEAGFDEAVDLRSVVLSTPRLPPGARRALRVRVSTDTGERVVDTSSRAPLTVALPEGPTRRLRVTLEAVAGLSATDLGAGGVEVRMVGPDGPLPLARGLRVPDGVQAADAAPVLSFAAGQRDRPACLRWEGRWECAQTLPRGDEDDDAVDRTFSLAAQGTFRVQAQGRLRAGEALDALLEIGRPMRASASSRALAHPAARPAAVLDGDPATGWLADPEDDAPELTLTWPDAAPVSGLVVLSDPSLDASRPRSVLVGTGQGAPTLLPVAADGEVRLPAPVVTRSVTLAFPEVTSVAALALDGLAVPLPVGISEVRVSGPDGELPRELAVAVGPVVLPCGQGPALVVDEVRRVDTSVTVAPADLLSPRTVTLQPCADSLQLGAGEHRLRLSRTAAVQPTALTLTPEAAAPPAPGPSRVQQVTHWGATERTLAVTAGEQAWLVVHENANAGWRATLDGRPLQAARLDGWQQAFLLPAGDGGQVRLEFTPQRSYRVALGVGAVLALVLVALAAGRRRRPPRAHPAPGGSVRIDQVRVLAPRTARLGALLAGAAVVVLGGAAGAAALVLGGLLVAARARVPDRLLLLTGPGALVLAGLLVAVRPWPATTLLSAPVQALCLLAAAALAVSLWPLPERTGQRPDDDPAPGPASAAPAPPPGAATPSPAASTAGA